MSVFVHAEKQDQPFSSIAGAPGSDCCRLVRRADDAQPYGIALLGSAHEQAAVVAAARVLGTGAFGVLSSCVIGMPPPC